MMKRLTLGLMLACLSTCCLAQDAGQQAAANEKARRDYMACLSTNRGPTASPAETIQRCRQDPNYFRNRDAQRAFNRDTAPRYDCVNMGGGMVSCEPN